jgi:mannose-6-phosphate isomerase-like protein (cupin superfamily)
MSIPIADFHESFVIHAKDAEVLGWSSVKIKLLADASDTGGALSVMRTTIAPHTEAATPHTHARSAETFYILDGRAEILTGTRVVIAGTGDLVIVPPNEVHTFGTPKSSRAEILIIQTPGLERFGYFRLIEQLMKGEATMEQVLATQERYDNHFVESRTWQAKHPPHGSPKLLSQRTRKR